MAKPNAKKSIATIMELLNQYNSLAKGLNEAGHKLCLAICSHVAIHGDWTVANTVFAKDSMEVGGRRDLMVKWLVKYAGLRVSGNKFVGFEGKEYAKEHMDEGRKNPFYLKDKGDEDTFKEFNLKERLITLINSANKAEREAAKRDKVEMIKKDVPEEVLRSFLNLCGYSVESLIIKEAEESDSKQIDLLAQTIEQDKAA